MNFIVSIIKFIQFKPIVKFKKFERHNYEKHTAAGDGACSRRHCGPSFLAVTVRRPSPKASRGRAPAVHTPVSYSTPPCSFSLRRRRRAWSKLKLFALSLADNRRYFLISLGRQRPTQRWVRIAFAISLSLSLYVVIFVVERANGSFIGCR